MGKIKELTYERIANLGHFETVRFGTVLSLEDGDDPAKELKRMVEFVGAQVEVAVKKNSLIKRDDKGARIPNG